MNQILSNMQGHTNCLVAKSRLPCRTGLARLVRISLALLVCFGAGSTAFAQQLNVVCSIPDLGSIVREIGGNQVSVTVLGKGTEDPHFMDARPSFVKTMSTADLFVQIGLELEVGWAPPVLRGARNDKVLPGNPGSLEVARAIQPMDVPTGTVTRAQGDIHPGGNPHFLTDPLSGLRVAALIRDKLSELRPNQKTYFDERYDAFAKRMASFLVGEELAKKYTVIEVLKLALLFEHGKLDQFLKSQGQEKLLGGWFGIMLPYYGTKVVDDHPMWPYFARTFGLKVAAHLEPLPGIQPTTQHMGIVVQQMKNEKIKIVLANAYYDPRHAQFVSGQTGAKVVSMANLVGARPGTDDYFSMLDYNVRQLAKALEGSESASR
jgi:zinc/manganese transport system substrate-binding protein